jgi:hypothetical protein
MVKIGVMSIAFSRATLDVLNPDRRTGRQFVDEGRLKMFVIAER